MDGMADHEIIVKYKDEVSPRFLQWLVKRVAVNVKVKETLELCTKEFIENNLPLILEAKALSLVITHRKLQEILSDDATLSSLSVSDLKNLVTQSKELDAMARLEEGKPTEIQEHRHLTREDIDKLIIEIKEDDPVLS